MLLERLLAGAGVTLGAALALAVGLPAVHAVEAAALAWRLSILQHLAWSN